MRLTNFSLQLSSVSCSVIFICKKEEKKNYKRVASYESEFEITKAEIDQLGYSFFFSIKKILAFKISMADISNRMQSDANLK